MPVTWCSTATPATWRRGTSTAAATSSCATASSAPPRWRAWPRWAGRAPTGPRLPGRSRPTAGPGAAGSTPPDGRYVVLGNFAEDVVTADFNGGPDLFVRDLQTAATSLVSARAALPVSGTPSARSVLSA